MLARDDVQVSDAELERLEKPDRQGAQGGTMSFHASGIVVRGRVPAGLILLLLLALPQPALPIARSSATWSG